MNGNPFGFVVQATDETLSSWGLGDTVSGSVVASLVGNSAAYWEQALPDGCHVAMVRLFLPVVRREEVFLGNVLLNDFLSKALIRSIERKGLGRIRLLANDLENYYYLYHGDVALDQMAECFRQEILDSLPDLYFGGEDLRRGIYGDVGRMLNFQLANREPYPVFAVPRALLRTLLNKVNSYIQSLDVNSLDVQRAVATLCFFYARGSRKVDKFEKKTGAYVKRSVSEMQSDFAFLLGAMQDRLLPHEMLREAFLLSDEGQQFDEKLYRDRKKNGLVDRQKIMAAIGTFLNNIEAEIAKNGVETVLVPLYEKALDIEPLELVHRLLLGTQLGFLRFHEGHVAGFSCRFCGANTAVVREKTILAGTGMTKFFNSSPKLPHPKQPGRESLCMRCGISSYLETKLLGMMFAADMPIPRQYNVVFHYGCHDETGARELAALIDEIFDLLRSFRQQVEDQRSKGEKTFFSLEYVKEELTRRAEQRRMRERLDQGEMPTAEQALASLIDDEPTAAGVEILGYMRPDVETKVYAIGAGSYRLLVFVLPQFEPLVRRRDRGIEVDWNFVPKRFSRSRLFAFTLLALLRKLCGCDGPYYFQSVPSLSPGGLDSNTFYVRGKAENADHAIRHFSAIVNFARRVVNVGKVRDRGRSPLVEWILLAERLEKDTLGTFSDVLRRTPMRKRDFRKENRDRFEFRPLAKYESIDETGVIDGIEYLKLIERLKQL